MTCHSNHADFDATCERLRVARRTEPARYLLLWGVWDIDGAMGVGGYTVREYDLVPITWSYAFDSGKVRRFTRTEVDYICGTIRTQYAVVPCHEVAVTPLLPAPASEPIQLELL